LAKVGYYNRMRVLPDVEQRIRREIRNARARDPLITVSELTERLEKKFNHGLLPAPAVEKMVPQITSSASLPNSSSSLSAAAQQRS
jgi:hypothetical protein